MTLPSLSVIVPVYNEEAAVEELHRSLRDALADGPEILFVDDGSTDRTRDVLLEIEKSDPNTRVLGFRRNFGKSHALAAAFGRARGETIATLDGDLQDDPREIPRLLEKLDEGFDLVGAWRREGQDSGWKVLGSKVFNALVSVFGGVKFRDINCGMKVFRREVREEIAMAGGFHRFLPLLAHWRGFRVCELPVRHHARKYGRSRYGGERVFRGLMDLVVILFLVRFTGRPGRYFAVLGGVLSLAGVAISAYLAYLRLTTGSIQSRFPFLALGLVLMVVGVQLFSMGLFAELLAFQFRSRRPFDPVVWEKEKRAGEKPLGVPDSAGSWKSEG